MTLYGCCSYCKHYDGEKCGKGMDAPFPVDFGGEIVMMKAAERGYYDRCFEFEVKEGLEGKEREGYNHICGAWRQGVGLWM